ncbi:trigger factor [Verminephrobacter eiseniae]|uniref:trigger factor n=1 Tax=Verminephrobacter eiseniae TaxID=364317 RepID=UPI0022378F0C|nr:trigger factor [Verminephrobacter eiseniae]MCW5260312.1 trigger factor [Verminephrobacter eiseniae]
MAVTVETLDKLERKMTLSLPVTLIQSEVDMRLRRMARTVKMDGFRPGKVPMAVVARRYGDAVQYEVLTNKVGEAFTVAANEANLRVAGRPRITETQGTAEGHVTFDAIFEVFPEVRIADLANVEIEKLSTEVTEASIDKTLQGLRKQRRSFAQRAHDAPAQDGDGVTVDFEGKIDGEPFANGKAENFRFVIGEGPMPKEFEDAVRGMKSGESKTFPLAFPTQYHGQEVAGKTADFLVTVKKIESAHLPEVGEALARSLGSADGSIEGLRADIRKTLEREISSHLRARNRRAVMNALLANADLELPKASVQDEIARLKANAYADLKQRGVKDPERLEIPEDKVRPTAERNVRLRLIFSEMVRAHGLRAKPEQVRAYVEELAASYEKPAEMVRGYYGDRRRMLEIESSVSEDNVTEFVFARAKVVARTISVDELLNPKDPKD